MPGSTIPSPPGVIGTVVSMALAKVTKNIREIPGNTERPTQYITKNKSRFFSNKNKHGKWEWEWEWRKGKI